MGLSLVLQFDLPSLEHLDQVISGTDVPGEVKVQ